MRLLNIAFAVSFGDLAELDEITNVAKALERSGLSNCAQEKLIRKFKSNRRKMVNSFGRCGVRIGRTRRDANDETGYDFLPDEKGLKKRVEKMHQWSSNFLLCENDFVFDLQSLDLI